MESLWFWLVAIMIAMYVIFDGFDLGAGIIHHMVARTGEERDAVLRSIGPVWDGNEVWLLAGGGVLYFAFPALYASGFSGFYLPLMIVLWLLILRGISIEFRHRIHSPVWVPFWDGVFSLSSLLLAVCYGAALGNVVRGVPLDEHGWFFEPLWTDFGVGADNGILDWYTVLVGVTAASALMLHGALWIALKCEGEIRRRARRIVYIAEGVTLLAAALVSASTFLLQPLVPASFAAHPWGWVFPAVAVAALGAILAFTSRGEDLKAFLSSCVFLASMLVSVAFGLYPTVLPSSADPQRALTIRNASAGAYGLGVGLVWWILGMVFVTGYFIYTYSRFAGRVKVGEDAGGY
jgi:cytochrome bd ubiquinol oxidase subunit II